MKAPNEKGFGHGTYVGSDARLRGEAALIRRDGKDHPLQAQFDKVSLGKLAYGWHDREDEDFDVDRWDAAKKEKQKGMQVSQDGGPMHAGFLRGRT